ncbi:MAG: STAS domain-containing protein [Chloroflexi bacterium]|nr:STAS domain-containing protein [Chloroflexota bacterium]
MAGKATVTARNVREGVSILDIQGEINAFAENALMDAYTQATSANARVIILNFTGLEYMNSSGIGLLVTLLIRVNRQKQKLLTYGLNEHYQQIFGLTRLNEAIRICLSESDALANA